MALIKPPSLGIDKTVSIIHKALAEVNLEATVQLHKRNKAIQVTVDDSHSQIQQLHKDNEELKIKNESLYTSLTDLKAQYNKYVEGVERK